MQSKVFELLSSQQRGWRTLNMCCREQSWLII